MYPKFVSLIVIFLSLFHFLPQILCFFSHIKWYCNIMCHLLTCICSTISAIHTINAMNIYIKRSTLFPSEIINVSWLLWSPPTMAQHLYFSIMSIVSWRCIKCSVGCQQLSFCCLVECLWQYVPLCIHQPLEIIHNCLIDSSSSGFICSQQVECYGSPLLSVLSISYTLFIA